MEGEWEKSHPENNLAQAAKSLALNFDLKLYNPLDPPPDKIATIRDMLHPAAFQSVQCILKIS